MKAIGELDAASTIKMMSMRTSLATTSPENKDMNARELLGVCR